MERIALIDFLKGIAIIGVIVIHTLLLAPKEGEAAAFVHGADLFFRFAVPFFIGVLGFMTYEKYRSVDAWGMFYRQKAMTLLLPYLLWSALYTLTPRIFTEYKDYLRTDPEGLLLGYGEVHLYFMVAYLGFLVLTPVVTGLFEVTPKAAHPWIGWGLLLLHIILLYQVEADVMARKYDTFYISTQSRLPLHWFGYYAGGMLLAMTKAGWLPWVRRHRGMLLAAGGAVVPVYLLVVGILLQLQVYLYIYHTPTLFLLSAAALLLWGWVYLRIAGTRLSRPIEALGRHSFAIYLSHILWLKLGWWVAGEWSLPLLSSLILTGAVALLGSVAYIPVHRRLFRPSNSRRAAS